jgi:cytochrome P450
MPKPPGLPGVKPIFGHILMFRKGPLNFINNCHRELGDAAWLQSPFRDIILVFKPEFIKHILQENNKNYRKSFGYDELKLLLGQGLLTSEGEYWRKQRRLAQPAFHKERIAYLVNIMGEAVRDTVDQWKKQYKDGDVLNITVEMNKLALEIVSRTLFQSDVSSKDIDHLNEALGIVIEVGAKRIRDPFQPPRWMPTKDNRESKQAVKDIQSLVLGIIDKRIKSEERFDDLLDMLIHTVDEETGERMTREALLDEVMTIFIAGHETTANALAFTWYLIASHPKEKEKLLAEIASSKLEQPGMMDLREMKFHRMVIDESLRLYPPAWIIGRQALNADKLGDFDVPALCTCGLPVYVIHRSAAYWKDPDNFIPERFNEENISSIPKFAYFPFGGGPRLCIGQMFAIYEMQIAMYILWKNFDFQLTEGYQMEIEPLITLRTKKPITMKIFIK